LVIFTKFYQTLLEVAISYIWPTASHNKPVLHVNFTSVRFEFCKHREL
jgi:hypothetical protein